MAGFNEALKFLMSNESRGLFAKTVKPAEDFVQARTHGRGIFHTAW